jgi:hypothetical protein
MNENTTAPSERTDTLDDANILPDGFAVADETLKNGEVEPVSEPDIFAPENDSDEPDGEDDDEDPALTMPAGVDMTTIPAKIDPLSGEQKTEGKIALTVTTHGKVYSCMTDSIADAIEQLGLKTTNTRTLIRAEYDGKVYEQVFFVAYARRIFGQKMARTLLEKRIRMKLNV